MANKISLLQQVDQKYWSGLTKQNSLAALGYTKGPAQLSTAIDQLYEINFGDDNIVSLIDKYPTIYTDQETYKWALRGTSERTIPLVKATYGISETLVTSSTTALVGQNFVPFYLYFGEKWFTAPAVIAGSYPEDYQVRIMADPVQTGNLWKYQVQIFGSNPANYMPVQELLAGIEYGQLYTPTERELSKRGSDIQYSSFFELHQTISTMRKSIQVPGSMIKMGKNVPLAYAFVDDNGKQQTRWINYLEWEFAKQCRREKAKLLMYGKSTVGPAGESMIPGESGNPIITGFGLYEQMNGSNMGFYNTFNMDAFASFLGDVSYNKIPEDKRSFLITTGQKGLEQFHRAAQTKYGAYPGIYEQNHKVWNGNEVTLREGQIKKFVWLNGIEAYVMHDPMLDSPTTVGKIPHPDGGYVSSYVYNIWDFGTDGGEANIAKVAIKGDEEYFIYVNGLRDAYTPSGSGMNPTPAAHAIDGYELHKMYNTSIRIKNPLRTARYLPNMYKSLGY